MDCSLSTWPSITQFDDFVWTGFGDIDPLESLERTKNNNPEASAPAISSHQVTKPSSSCDTLLCNNNTQNMHSQSTNFYTISPSESLVARRWESMNAVDLTSVLETAFPSEGVLSTPTTEDGYALYSDEMLMQPEQQLGGEVDVFMDDPLSEVADAMFATPPCDDILKDISSVCNDSTSLPSSLDQMDCKCSTVDSDTSGFINPSTFSESPVDDTHRSMVSGVDCTVQSMEASEVLSSNPAQCRDIIQSLDYYPLSPLKLTGSRDVRTANQSIGLDSKDPVTVQQHDCTQSSTMSQWSTSQLRPKKSLKLDGGKYVHQCTVQVGDGYPGSASPQAKLVDAARLSSELKLNRAQVSRARRLAASQRRAEGRAKKYPLQKLIRMSSSTACARDRLGNSLDTSVPTLHPPVHMVVQTQLPGGGQSLPMSTVNLQTPTLLPVVFQAPQMASSHNLHTHMNPVQVSPRYRYRQQQLMAPSEDNSLSSGSSAAQYRHAQQAMRSLTMAPTLGLQSLTNSANSLDATLLEQLQFVLNKMNRELRLGIRDALYRLAKSANQRQNRVESASYSDSNSSHIDPVETQTNSVDRWIVNLLFCKQPSVPEAKYQSYLPIPSNATSQSVLESASISISQPWNSCGSFLNLQEQPPHVMTGS